MNLTVNCAESVGEFHHFWQSTGFTPAYLLLNADMQQAMAYVGSIPHGGITWVRIHYLLELVIAKDLDTDEPTYDWSRLDTALDVVVRNGLKPIFELMGNVAGHFDDYTDRTQALSWRRLVRDLARHLIDRYGDDEIRSWLFETWNEPDIGFWRQSDEAFLIYYDACDAGLHEAGAELQLGGPGTCRTLSSTFKRFLAHCDTGTNSLTGEPARRPAFISVHEKGVRAHPEELTPNSMGMIERESRIIDYIKTQHPALADVPFMNNECDPQVGWGTVHTWRARPYYAAIVAKIINQHVVELIDGRACNYELLGNDNGFLGTWGHRTLLARFGESDHIDHGQAEGHRDVPRSEEDLTRRRFELIKKPVFNLMTMLSLLGDERVPVKGIGGAADPLGVIATRRGASQVAVLIYHSLDRIAVSGKEPIRLELRGLPFDRATSAYYRIDADHDGPFAVWENIGAPERLDAAQYAQLRARQELTAVMKPHDVTITGGTLTVNLAQPLPGVTLVLLSQRPDHRPERVTGLRAEHYEGMTDQDEVLLMWDGLPSRVIRSYEVFFATDADGPYERVNRADQLDTAYLHARAVDKGYYQVRALDYWGCTGDFSEILQT
ncbi:MAG: GH39 family glycosyl hydrolase [Anaerolineae bacterium]